MFAQLRKHLELIRFSHTVFAMPFALLAAVLAWHARPEQNIAPIDLIAIILCMVSARSAAMAFNRIVDREIDAQNPRTALRHLPSGELSLRSVWLFMLASSVAFIASTALFLPENPLPILLSVPLLLFLLGYSYSKRFTTLAHFWLGAALMLAPVSVWIALRGDQIIRSPIDGLPAVILGGAVMFWVAGFDMMYACQDAGFDAQTGLHSIPGRYGIPTALHLAMLCHAVAVIFLLILPLVFPLQWVYWCGIAALAILLTYEHVLVRPDELDRVNTAFFHVNAVISIGVLLLTTLDLLLFVQ
ncbi:MAG: UbiA-like polyprenyltransferase [Pirellulales bacterium]|nr:UbiA-like polyprenyltransferase [Pirellulales bacterium]